MSGYDALFLVDEAEADDPGLLQLRDPLRVDLARDVDEAARPVGERELNLFAVERERLRDESGSRRRVANLTWVRVDRRRLAADRELDAGPVEDRAAPGGIDPRRLVLPRRQPLVAPGADTLQPSGPHEHGREGEGEDREDEADSPVGQPHLRRSR